MSRIVNWGRQLLIVFLLGVSAALGLAQTRSTGTYDPVSSSSQPLSIEETAPAGNPQLGMFIIAGIIGFLILVAWLLTRVSEESHQGDDRSLLG
jgi:hypothetical protein